MYILNKIAGVMLNPANAAIVVMTVALTMLLFSRCGRESRRWRSSLLWLLAGAGIWLWLWSTPLANRLVGASLERPYLVEGGVPSVADYPLADVIELHGGGMGTSDALKVNGANGGNAPYAEMWTSADRVWQAARLWCAGKAPVIFVTGGGAGASTLGLLRDFGVPTNAVVLVESPRNTEEEARCVAAAMRSGVVRERRTPGERPRVLVVTSAWHMRRTMMMYAKYAPELEAIPAPGDFENSLMASKPWGISDFLPDPQVLAMNCVAAHEWIGIAGYRFLRR